MVIRRAAVLSSKTTLGADDLVLEAPPRPTKGTLPSGLTLAELEREYIEMVLRENDGHRGRAAKALGIDAKTLYN